MEIAGAVCVVTGAAGGIGEALARRLVADGAAGVVADVLENELEAVAADIGAVAVPTDVRSDIAIRALVDRTLERFGRIDLFCSNAGIATFGGAEVPDEEWQRIWEINTLAHIRAARAVLPEMIQRGSGHLLQTASAAGLLSQIGSAPYSVTKHAAVAFAEWVAITHGHQGIGVSVLCPQGVRTRMTELSGADGGVVGLDGMLEPGEVAGAAVRGLADGAFLILPHPEVERYFQNKANDYGRWIGGMRKLQARFAAFPT